MSYVHIKVYFRRHTAESRVEFSSAKAMVEASCSSNNVIGFYADRQYRLWQRAKPTLKPM